MNINQMYMIMSDVRAILWRRKQELIIINHDQNRMYYKLRDWANHRKESYIKDLSFSEVEKYLFKLDKIRLAKLMLEE